MSGYSLNKQIEELMEMGCNGFIQKPFDIVKLSQTLREVLEKVPNPDKPELKIED